MFGFLTVTVGLALAAAFGWGANDVAHNGLDMKVPAVMDGGK